MGAWLHVSARLTASFALPLAACGRAPAFSGGQSRLSTCYPHDTSDSVETALPVHSPSTQTKDHIWNKSTRVAGVSHATPAYPRRHHRIRHSGGQRNKVKAPPCHARLTHKLPNKLLTSLPTRCFQVCQQRRESSHSDLCLPTAARGRNRSTAGRDGQ